MWADPARRYCQDAVFSRLGLISRSTVRMACVAAISSAACADELRSPAVLTDEAVVMGISLAVLEDGPHAADLAALPADRPRAEVLPLDAVELDALVANVDGPLALDDAAWVLCGDGCLASLARQGERHGALERANGRCGPARELGETFFEEGRLSEGG